VPCCLVPPRRPLGSQGRRTSDPEIRAFARASLCPRPSACRPEPGEEGQVDYGEGPMVRWAATDGPLSERLYCDRTVIRQARNLDE
jgi:hypothetical protein